ncbi:hypothetical protein [Flavonifractor plautii]|uniref:hypothetical protein n=1 Tax=Flavonifractor plautii TaxID=292800 RepID=UPI0018A8DE45|nr:hypothetical protein [Flavonifractor plautii]
MRAIDSDALKEYIKKTDLTAVERGALLQAISNMPTLTPPNEPLTLEELRKMDGEPVYLIVDDQYEPLKMWALIEVVETANCVILTNNLGGRNEYYDNDEMKDDGVTAYRRPPEGEA